jgi:hypothetical protein
VARFNAMSGVDDTLRKLTALSVQMRDGLADVVRKATEQTHRAAVAAAPNRSGAYREAIKTTYFDDGLTGSVFVAPHRDPGGRWGAGMRPKNLPIWLEYGTRRAAERPHLVTSARSAATAFQADTLRVVTNAVKAAE